MEIIKAGTKVVLCSHAGMAGTYGYEFYELIDDMTEEALSGYAWDFGKSNAEMYGVYPKEEYADTDITEEELDSDDYSDNIEGWYELYDPKLHDGKTMTGTPHFGKL